MSIHQHIISRLSLIIFSFALAQNARAEEPLLSSKPSKCISLSQGLVCYQHIQMQWQTPDIGDYCIVQIDSNRKLQCWQQQRKGRFEFEFAEKQSQVYALRRQGENLDLAKTLVDLKWVYKNKHRDRLRWRVF